MNPNITSLRRGRYIDLPRAGTYYYFYPVRIRVMAAAAAAAAAAIVMVVWRYDIALLTIAVFSAGVLVKGLPIYIYIKLIFREKK